MKEELLTGILSLVIQYAKHQSLFWVFLAGLIVTVAVAMLTGFSRVATFSGSLAMLAVAVK